MPAKDRPPMRENSLQQYPNPPAVMSINSPWLLQCFDNPKK